MPTAVEWLTSHISIGMDDDGNQILRWLNREGNDQGVPLQYVADRFGATIEAALASGADVADAVAAGEVDGGWKDIFSWWAESGLI